MNHSLKFKIDVGAGVIEVGVLLFNFSEESKVNILVLWELI